jgi:2-polyprenyl-3-methyl-5-hydroxy-6-metoxy-1,4-benzoquinol methylase
VNGLESCRICHKNDWQPVLVKNNYSIARCRACGTQQVTPVPPLCKLFEHYQDSTYFRGEEAQGYASYADMHKVLRRQFVRRLALLARQLPARGHLLDFGCADGYFLELARAVAWRIAGVELSRDMIHQAQSRLGVPIAATLTEVRAADFDAISMWEVIEHLPDPVGQLRALLDRLRPGGVLMLSTPNTGHWQARHSPAEWDSYRPPSHLFFFTEETLRTTLAQAGFERVIIQRTAPLPRLPRWLRWLSAPLQHQLGTGRARFWIVKYLLWRGIRFVGWAWQKIAHRRDDVFMTLEAVAFQSR